jgi:hypothetical protein
MEAIFKKNYQIVDDLASDLMMLSLNSCLEVSPYEVLTHQSGVKLLSYYCNQVNNMVNYILYHPNNRSKEKAKLIFKFFVELAFSLYQKRDYQTSLMIYCSLNHVSELFVEEKKKCSLTKKWKNLDEFFSIQGGKHLNLKNQIDCDLNSDVLSVPYMGLLLHDVELIRSSQDTRNEDGTLNFEKLRSHAVVVSELAKYQRGLIRFWKFLPKPFVLKTNVKTYLQRSFPKLTRENQSEACRLWKAQSL